MSSFSAINLERIYNTLEMSNNTFINIKGMFYLGFRQFLYDEELEYTKVHGNKFLNCETDRLGPFEVDMGAKVISIQDNVI